MRPSGSTAWNAATGICPSLSHTLATGRTLSRCLRSLERSAFCVPMASVRPPREPAAYDDDASMQAPDVTYLQRVAAAQWSAAQHGCSAVLR